MGMDRDFDRDRGYDRDRTTGTVARTGAAPSGSDARPDQADPNIGRSRWNPAAFCRSGGSPKAGKTRPGLLDIAGSLC